MGNQFISENGQAFIFNGVIEPKAHSCSCGGKGACKSKKKEEVQEQYECECGGQCDCQ